VLLKIVDGRGKCPEAVYPNVQFIDSADVEKTYLISLYLYYWSTNKEC
jgi:hypothetical protein